MKRDSLEASFKSSFLSCEKDYETILKKLFVESKSYSDYLKSLLIINTPDCIDNIGDYKKHLDDITIADMKKQGYIRMTPKIRQEEYGEVKSYLLINFDNFTPNSTNPEFRDCYVMIDILCNTDEWDLGNYRLRPLKIAGYIDAILNKSRLSGIGQLLFAGCNELILDENLSGYVLTYAAIHGTDDLLPEKDDESDF